MNLLAGNIAVAFRISRRWIVDAFVHDPCVVCCFRFRKNAAANRPNTVFSSLQLSASLPLRKLAAALLPRRALLDFVVDVHDV